MAYNALVIAHHTTQAAEVGTDYGTTGDEYQSAAKVTKMPILEVSASKQVLVVLALEPYTRACINLPPLTFRSQLAYSTRH